MTTSASVFYGDLATTWSLVRAAEAHKLIHKQLVAMDLIIARKSNGLLVALQSNNSATSISSCPLELLSLIKDQLYAIGVEEVTSTWQSQFLNNVELDDALVSEKEAFITKAKGFEIDRAWDWVEWCKELLLIEEYDEWNFTSGTLPSMGELISNSHVLVDPFLSTFKLGCSSSPGLTPFIKNTELTAFNAPRGPLTTFPPMAPAKCDQLGITSEKLIEMLHRNSWRRIPGGCCGVMGLPTCSILDIGLAGVHVLVKRLEFDKMLRALRR